MRVLLTLKPKDLYVAVKLMHRSRAGVCSIKKLADTPAEVYDLADPLGRMERKGLLKLVGEGMDSIAQMCKPLAEFTLHLQSFTEQLELLMMDGTAPPDPKKQRKKDDMAAVMVHYAKARGITKDDLEAWVAQEFKRNIRSIIRLIATAGTVQKSCEVIDSIKSMMEKEGLDWSLNGAVINRMHGVLRRDGKGARKWDW